MLTSTRNKGLKMACKVANRNILMDQYSIDLAMLRDIAVQKNYLVEGFAIRDNLNRSGLFGGFW